MDRLGIEILRQEMKEDGAIVADAARVARDHFATGGRIGNEAAAFQLARCYNTIELLAQRVARAFENHIDPSEGWHVDILRRMALVIPGVRPALFPKTSLPNLQTLRSFRHVVRHAYDLAIVREDLEGVLKKADEVAAIINTWCETFCEAVTEGLPPEQ